MQTVEITISGGAVQDVQCPPGTQVIIRDYDVDESDWENFDIRKDSAGDAYQRMTFGGDMAEEELLAGCPKVQRLFDVCAVDWDLLRSQKERLVEIAAARRTGGGESHRSSDIQTLDGLISLLDHIQDEASLSLSEKAVFGNPAREGVNDAPTLPSAESKATCERAIKPALQSDTEPLEPS